MKKSLLVVLCALTLVTSCKDEEVVKETVFLNQADLTGKIKSISYTYGDLDLEYVYIYKEFLINEVELRDKTEQTTTTFRPEFNADSVIIKLTTDVNAKTFSYSENAQLEEIIEQSATKGEVISTFKRSVDGKLERFERYTLDQVNSRKTTLLRIDLKWVAGSLKSYSKQGVDIEKDEVKIESNFNENELVKLCLKHGVFIPVLAFLGGETIVKEQSLFSNSVFSHSYDFDAFGKPIGLSVHDNSNNQVLLNITIDYF